MNDHSVFVILLLSMIFYNFQAQATDDKFIKRYAVMKVNDEETGHIDFVSDGKKCISLNLRSPAGAEIFRNLVSSADVLIEPFRPGVMEKLGFGPKVLLAENPRLIYARLTGYGQSGHLNQVAGHDINYLSLSGLLSLYGWRGKHPTPPINFSELAGGSLICFSGILLALIDRNKTGQGQIIDCSISEGLSYIGSWFMRSKDMLFNQARGHNLVDGGSHFYDTYETKDGKFMAVGALESKFYGELIDKLGFRYEEVPQHGKSDKKREKFRKKFLEKTQQEWIEFFGTCDACVTPVLSFEEAANFKHNVDRNLFHLRKDGRLTAARAPRLSNHPEKIEEMPFKTNDTYEILKNLGYSDEKIREFEIEGTVTCKI